MISGKKKILIIIKSTLFTIIYLLGFAFIQGCDNLLIDSDKERIHGTGNTVVGELDIENFSEVKIETFGNAVISQGEEYSISFEVDEAIVNRIEISKSGNALVIDIDHHYNYNNCEYTVYVTLPNIRKLYSNSAGNISGNTTIESEELFLCSNSAGNISLNLNVDNLESRINSAGNINLTGIAVNHYSVIESAGNLRAFGLESGEVDLIVSSAGDASVYVLNELNANISSVGSVYYKGNPSVQSRISNLGNLVHID